jgi:hypothetical protein
VAPSRSHLQAGKLGVQLPVQTILRLVLLLLLVVVVLLLQLKAAACPAWTGLLQGLA